MNKVKKRILIVLSAILATVVFALLAFLGLYFTRIQREEREIIDSYRKLNKKNKNLLKGFMDLLNHNT